MSRPVIYSNGNGRLVVLDLPSSIAWAQACPSHRLLSTPPPHKPYEPPEPRGDRLIQFQQKIPAVEREHRAHIESSLRVAIAEVQLNLAGLNWCHPRVHHDQALETVSVNHHGQNTYGASMGKQPPLVLSSTVTQVKCFGEIREAVVHNPHNSAVDLVTADHGCFHVAPNSTFISSSIEAGLACFHGATRTLAPATGLPDAARITFDLVLLDPPWSNRSVRHSRSYRSTEHQMSDPFMQVLPVLQYCLADNAYVAIWITNKAQIRLQVTEAFESLHLSLVEQWIWLKVTSNGEAVTPLDGVWRKPYEILLLFQARPTTQAVQQRILCAVPDVHSRKPHLKTMLEPLLPPKYTALELFARSLTAGWWSWGDEVLKFQHEDWWTTDSPA